MKNYNWQFLDYDYCCNIAPGIDSLHDYISSQYEYGLNWHEFVNDVDCQEKIFPLIQKWWDSLFISKQIKLLEERQNNLYNQSLIIGDVILKLNYKNEK